MHRLSSCRHRRIVTKLWPGAPLLLLALLAPRQLSGEPTPTVPAPTIADARRVLEQRLNQVVDEDRLVRRDGYVYAIDVGLLALANALGRDRGRYVRLVDLARRDLVVDRAAGLDAAAVTWRRRPGGREAPDASGTTEALALAQALLVGAETFARPADAALALALLDGYGKHAAVDNGTWIVRNYYNFATRTFATNSYLIDYGPDLLLHAARTRPGLEGLRTTARRSVALIRAAQRPNGLIDTLVQPELKTLFSFVIFSPNDVIQIEHSALVAELAAGTAPDVARRLLDFIRPRLADLHAAYFGRSGEPQGPALATAGPLAAIARLAVKVGDRDLLARIRAPLAAHAYTIGTDAGVFDLHAAAQTLLSLRYLELCDGGKTIPLTVAADDHRSAEASGP
jgi:hypothetical protein